MVISESERERALLVRVGELEQQKKEARVLCHEVVTALEELKTRQTEAADVRGRSGAPPSGPLPSGTQAWLQPRSFDVQSPSRFSWCSEDHGWRPPSLISSEV